MKKFILTLILYIVILGIVVLSINYICVLSGISDYEETSKFRKVPENIQICNFGSSHGYFSFNYSDLETQYVSFNFALSSQRLSYDYKILQTYQDKLSPGAIVFIPVSYFSFFGKDETESAFFESLNRRYYRFLPKDKIKNLNPKVYFYERYLPSLVMADSIFTKLTNQILGINEDIWDKNAYEIDVRKHAYGGNNKTIYGYVGHIKANVDDGGNRIYNYEEIISLYNMIALCYQRDVTPILVTTPFLKEYTNEIEKNDPKFYSDFNRILERVIKDTNVQYYDYARDSRFSDDYSLFINSDHMNRVGATKFTYLLLNEVQKTTKINALKIED